MGSTQHVTADAATREARRNLVEIHRRCLEDRHAYFPAGATRLIASSGELRVVVLGSRGPSFGPQIDGIEAMLRQKVGRIEAIVHDRDDPDRRDDPRFASYRQISLDDFFADVPAFAGCLVVDRTSTWYPGIRYKVRLKQAGFEVMRIEQFLSAPGFDHAASPFRAHSDLMIERFDQFLALERHWQDDLSRQTYYYALAAFISMNFQYFALHCGDFRERYFPRDIDLKLGADTVYADCGSNDGAEIFIFAERAHHRFKAVHAFEPDRHNFIQLTDNVQRHVAQRGPVPIYCHELGVFDVDGYVPARGSGRDVAVGDPGATGGEGLHVCQLDTRLDELTHLRLEVEGAELQALQGAARLLRTHRPTLCVSAYHLADDFPHLLGFIENTDLNYQLALRHQSLEPGVLCIYAI